MKPTTQSAVLAAVAGLLLWLASGDVMLRLVLESFRIPLLLSAATLAALAVATLRVAWVERRRERAVGRGHVGVGVLGAQQAEPDDGGRPDVLAGVGEAIEADGSDSSHHIKHVQHADAPSHAHPGGAHGVPRIGLLLLVPVVLVVAFGIRPLGPSSPASSTRPSAFLSDVHTSAPRSSGGSGSVGPARATTILWLSSAPLVQPDSEELREPVRIIGYVNGSTPRGFTLSRHSMFCCAADAREVSIDIESDEAPADGTWVEVTGTYGPPPDGSDLAKSSTRHRLVASEPPRAIAEPANPYES